MIPRIVPFGGAQVLGKVMNSKGFEAFGLSDGSSSGFISGLIVGSILGSPNSATFQFLIVASYAK